MTLEFSWYFLKMYLIQLMKPNKNQQITKSRPLIN